MEIPGSTESNPMAGALPRAVASFDVPTLIPGTGQYDDFLTRSLIVESNLDRRHLRGVTAPSSECRTTGDAASKRLPRVLLGRSHDGPDGWSALERPVVLSIGAEVPAQSEKSTRTGA